MRLGGYVVRFGVVPASHDGLSNDDGPSCSRNTWETSRAQMPHPSRRSFAATPNLGSSIKPGTSSGKCRPTLCASIIDALCRSKQPLEALAVFAEMRARGVQRELLTYSTLIEALGKEGCIDQGCKLISEAHLRSRLAGGTLVGWRSDVLGQFMPLVGRDWSQTGVARLFSALKNNGYKLVFMSARAITQADQTRIFLANLMQDGDKLPDGPVMLSPEGIFPSLYREVIRRTPQEFKSLACREAFRSDYNPFYAGFGNRTTDVDSYLQVGVPPDRIYTINPRGEVLAHNVVDVTCYTSTIITGF